MPQVPNLFLMTLCGQEGNSCESIHTKLFSIYIKADRYRHGRTEELQLISRCWENESDRTEN